MKTKLITGFLAVGLLSAQAANANLITLLGSYNNSTDYYDATAVQGTISCNADTAGQCEGLVSSTPSGTYADAVPTLATGTESWSASTADLFVVSPSDGATELAFVEAVTGLDFDIGTQIDGGGATIYSFTTSALYVLFKLGNQPAYFLLHNTSGGAVTFDFAGAAGQGAGLSHYVSYGGPPVSVPEPTTALLLGAGLLGLALTRRRRHV